MDGKLDRKGKKKDEKKEEKKEEEEEEERRGDASLPSTMEEACWSTPLELTGHAGHPLPGRDHQRKGP